MTIQALRFACLAVASVALTSLALVDAPARPPHARPTTGPADGAAAPVEFSRDVRPILSRNCFECHGPDSAARKAKLRLDVAGVREDERGILVPGSAEESLLYQRLTAPDPDDRMPPAHANKDVTADDIALVRRWIDEGAVWEDHWSFLPVASAEVPPTRDAPPGWDANPIDAFVLARLAERGLAPSPRADRRTLIRRVTLDLTGVPPTPEDVRAFVDDERPDAYERVVDRLLSSTAYAERMTLAWMDAARYGDTSVFHADGPRDMWLWRDWVIDAYDSNMPFDRFTIEQLAGDLLPDPTIDQRVATGFLRNNATTDEGGAIDEEFRVQYMVDRVKTTGNVFLGLSTECAQCHDHKFDPILQEDYYRFFAFFNQSTERGMQTRTGNEAPIVRVPSEEQEARDAELTARIEAVEAELASAAPPADAYAAWIDEQREELVRIEPPTLGPWYSLGPIRESSSKLAFETAYGPESEVDLASSPREDLSWTRRDEWVDDEVHSFAPSNNSAMYLFRTVTVARAGERTISLGSDDTLSVWLNGEELLKQESYRGAAPDQERVTLALREGENELVLKVVNGAGPWGFYFKMLGLPLPDEVIAALAATAEVAAGDTTGPNAAALAGDTIDSDPIDSDLEGSGLVDSELVDSGPADSDLGASGGSNGGSLPSAVEEASVVDGAGAPRAVLASYYTREVWEPGKALVAELDALRTEQTELARAVPTVMAMMDVPDGRQTYVLMRGQYDAPLTDRPVEPGVLDFLLPMPEGAPANRLGLAQWIVDPAHPLTARVAVNRYWAMLFGEGLVGTVMDFGSQGEWPTHPELLDWLAHDFVASGWDVKRMLRSIVTSETYCQASRRDAARNAVDPENRLLWRAPRYRLQGEFLRDQALAVAGLLVNEVGGPGVRPYQPEGLWNEVSLDKNVRFMRDSGDKLYRKSMYIYWKRSAPMPAMTTFDAPTRETCVVQRARTNTPLQALVTLNDVQFVEAARKLAARMLAAGDDFETRLDLGFELCTSHPANDARRDAMREVFDAELTGYRADPERALELLAVGESPRDETLDPAEHAAWTVLASILLNLDETLNRD